MQEYPHPEAPIDSNDPARSDSQFLESVDVQSIPDMTTRQVVEKVVSSPMQSSEKVQWIKNLLTQNRIQETLRKASSLVDGHVNSFAIKTLQDLQQRGHQLLPAHIATAENAISCLQEDFNRLGREHIHRDLDPSFPTDAFPLSTIEHLRVETQRRLHQENQNRRKNLSICVF